MKPVRTIARFVRKALGRSRRQPLLWHMLRPFELSDLRPVGPNQRMSGPDFVGVGTPKAGTTWWHSLIQAHPSVEPNRLRRKELQYFSQFGFDEPSRAQADTYRSAFARADGCVSGEWSPNYLTYPFALNHLHQVAPETRILLMVRNPVDRAVSGLNHFRIRLQRWELDPDYERFLWTYSFFPDAFAQGLLAPAVGRLIERFPRERILVLQYERCRADTLSELARTYRFLGISDDFVPEDATRPVNARPRIHSGPTEDQRLPIADHFRDDVRSLAELLPELDLSLWPDFSR